MVTNVAHHRPITTSFLRCRMRGDEKRPRCKPSRKQQKQNARKVREETQAAATYEPHQVLHFASFTTATYPKQEFFF